MSGRPKIFGHLLREIINAGKCVTCGTCVSVCPVDTVKMVNSLPRLTGVCIACGMCYNNCPQVEFDVDAVRRSMSPSFSPWSEGRAAYCKKLMTRLLTFGPYFVIPTIVYVLAVAILIGRRARWGAFILTVTLSLVLCCSVYPHRLAGWLFPGSHAFLDDYVYLPGAYTTEANSAPGETIVAYDVNSFRGTDRRIIGFADGHVMSFSDERAKPIFQAQGIPYPKPD